MPQRNSPPKKEKITPNSAIPASRVALVMQWCSLWEKSHLRDQRPPHRKIKRWVQTALTGYRDKGEVCIRVVDDDEIQSLNRQYRGQNKSTNVLSFPADVTYTISGEPVPIGDLVISASVVEREAKVARCSFEAHFAHMVVHGCLHLVGLDHIDPEEATRMEAEEVTILAKLGFPNPYSRQEA